MANSCAPVRAASNCAVRCNATAGVGTNLAVTLRFVGGGEAAVARDATLSYVPPTVASVHGPGATEASTAGGQLFTLVGEGFGPPWLELAPPSVRYGGYAAANCRVLSDAQIECATAEGTGGPHALAVDGVGGQARPVERPPSRTRSP